MELLARLQDLPYLAPEFNFSKNPLLNEIIQKTQELNEEKAKNETLEAEKTSAYDEFSTEYAKAMENFYRSQGNSITGNYQEHLNYFRELKNQLKEKDQQIQEQQNKIQELES